MHDNYDLQSMVTKRCRSILNETKGSQIQCARLGGALGYFNVTIQDYGFMVSSHYMASGTITNRRTGYGRDLPTILTTFKNTRNGGASRGRGEVNMCSECGNQAS